MCGIIGLIYKEQASINPQVLNGMTGALAHRGPDGWGIEINHQIGLGHRRLSIIDLELGKQPLSNEDGKVWITFNGEIYNYRELRNQLQTQGHIFRTDSDTEVIVHAYEQWGDQCVEHFRGMFAFGIADYRNRRIFLARDHLGIKPLYYLHTDRFFAFASELQAFYHLPNLRLDIDRQAIDQYLRFGYIPAPKTIFQQVRKLPPAHRMSIAFDGQLIGPEEYWAFVFQPNRNRSEADWLAELDWTLRDSVKAHLVADVPFGAFLSGGVDSSAVVAYMAQILDRPVRTFSIGFEEQEYSEVAYANEAAKRWNTEHHIEIVRPDALEILPKLVQHYGEPFGDSSAIPTYYVCKIARSQVPMVLSGDGGDELFAGYNSYRSWMRWLSYDGINSPRWRQALRPLAERLLPGRHPRRPGLKQWQSRMTALAAAERQTLWRPEYLDELEAPLELIEQEFFRTRGFSYCNIAQYIDIKSYLPYDILTKVDIASMMHGLEVRTPITDVRVLEFAATIPESLNIRKNGDGEWEGKLLLKKLMRRYYPPEFLHRPKMGFGVPIEKWFALDGAKRFVLNERLLNPDSPLYEYFEPAAVKNLLNHGYAGQHWILLFLDEWLRQFKQHLTL